MASKQPGRHAAMRDEHQAAGDDESLFGRWSSELRFQQEYSENGEGGEAAGDVEEEEAPADKKPTKRAVTASALRFALYGLDVALAADGHDTCDIAAFCRNPLHPGPCKGWKHTLKAVAPGLHKSIERDRIAKVEARRAERAAAGGTAKPRALKHQRTAAFWSKAAATPPAPLKDGEHRQIVAPDDTKVEIFQTGTGMTTVQVRSSTGSTRPESRSFDHQHQALAHFTEVAAKLAAEQDPGRDKPKRTRTPKVATPDGGPIDGDGDGKLNEHYEKVGGDDVGSTRTDDGDGAKMPEVKPLKTQAQRDALRVVLGAGAAGYDNRRGYLTKKRRDQMLADGLVEQHDDGRLVITEHGRAVHEASIPRRNGEEIGFDGKTATERQAALDAAEGEEKKRLAAEAKAQFERGIPNVRPAGVEVLGTPGMQRVRDSMRKTAESLEKDLGEGLEDFGADVSPAAKEWQDRSYEAEKTGSDWHQLKARASWLRTAAAADPDHATEYNAMADTADADADAMSKRWDTAIVAANDARDALAATVVSRYQAKGRRKTASALKLTDARRDNVEPDSGPNVQRRQIADEVAARDATLADLADDLTPEQVEQGRRSGNAYTASVVEDTKARREAELARYDASIAHGRLAEQQRVPSMLRNESPYAEERAAAQDAVAAADRRERAARARVDVTRENRRRAADQFQRTADALRNEQEIAQRERRLDEPAAVGRGQVGTGTDRLGHLVQAFKDDADSKHPGSGFIRGENLMSQGENRYPYPDPRDGALTAIAQSQGWGLPATGSVDDAVGAGGVELWRGTRPHDGVSAQEQFDAMRDDPDFALGSGIYGNGIYFSVEPGVAESFAVADPDKPKLATAEGGVVRVAMDPNARIIDYDEVVKLRKEWIESGATRDVPALSDQLRDEGRFAAALGYDAIRVTGKQDGHWYTVPNPLRGGRPLKRQSKATQYVVLNRGALTMEATP